MAWSEVEGQSFASDLLKSLISSKSVPNAVLLVGPEGVGKRKLALIATKALNCLSDKERPCDECKTCRQIDRHIHPDIHTLEPEGASRQIKIESVRQVLSRISLRPFSASFSVVLIDEADRLSEEAGNSLLKTLEEPSSFTRMILTTSNLEHCLRTLVSRCQIIRCNRVVDKLIHGLLEGQAEYKKRTDIVRSSRGSVARAHTLIQQWDSHERILKQFAHNSTVDWAGEIVPKTREEVLLFLEIMMMWLRDLLFVATGNNTSVVHVSFIESLEKQAMCVDIDRCLKIAERIIKLHGSIEQFANPKLVYVIAREEWLSILEENKSNEKRKEETMELRANG